MHGGWNHEHDLDDARLDNRSDKLLEEIRDLQKLHVENYKDAQKPAESIDIQKRAVRRQRITLLVTGVLLLAFLIFLAWSSHSTLRLVTSNTELDQYAEAKMNYCIITCQAE